MGGPRDVVALKRRSYGSSGRGPGLPGERCAGPASARRARIADDLAVEHLDAPGDAGGDGLVVGDDHDGDALGVEFFQQRQQRGTGGRVQIAGRLVGEHDRRLPGHGTGYRDPLPLTAGQLGGAGALFVPEPHPFQRRGGLVTTVRQAGPRVQQPVRHVVDDGLVLGQEELLEHEPDPVRPQPRQLPVTKGRDVQPGYPHHAAAGPIRAVRERFGPGLALQADANAAYTLASAPHLRALDAFGLLLLEQPLAADDLLGHAKLARMLTTPICLDESITSPRAAATALRLGACSVINIKPARVGGYLAARAIHDLCAAHGVPVWCGGMLETGIGRAANLALAALENFTLPGDISATARYFTEDITPPFVLEDGHISVPSGPGTGVEILRDVLDRLTIHRQTLH